MKQIVLTLLFVPLLISCQSEQKTLIHEDSELLDYEDFMDIKLEWKNLFSPAKSQYFVYIYSVSCGHCERIKEEVLNYIYDDRESYYLMECCDEIPLSVTTDETFGKTTIDEVSILGTPTLLQITEGYLSLNIAGEKMILDFLARLPHNN